MVEWFVGAQSEILTNIENTLQSQFDLSNVFQFNILNGDWGNMTGAAILLAAILAIGLGAAILGLVVV